MTFVKKKKRDGKRWGGVRAVFARRSAETHSREDTEGGGVKGESQRWREEMWMCESISESDGVSPSAIIFPQN